MVLFSYGVLLSAVLATSKIVSLKNKVYALAVCVALLVFIPAQTAKQVSTLTMQIAYQVCKKFDMSQYQMNAYNFLSVLMMYLPWLLVELMSPKEEKPRKRRSRRRKVDEDDDDD